MLACVLKINKINLSAVVDSTYLSFTHHTAITVPSLGRGKKCKIHNTYSLAIHHIGEETEHT